METVTFVLLILSFVFAAYTWSQQGPRIRVSTRFTHHYIADRGGNHFAIEVMAANPGRGSAQVVGWSLVSRRNIALRPKWYRRLNVQPQRRGVRHSWNGGLLPGSDPLPLRLEGNAEARWTVSLVDDAKAFPTLDQLIPDHEARVEVEVGGRRRRACSRWFVLPSRDGRRCSNEIAKARGTPPL